MPAGVPSAVPEAGPVADEDLIRTEEVPVRAVARWLGDPPAVRRLHELAQHILGAFDWAWIHTAT